MTHYYRIRDGKRCVEPAFCRAPQCDCEPATRQEIVADLRRRADALDRDAELQRIGAQRLREWLDRASPDPETGRNIVVR